MHRLAALLVVALALSACGSATSSTSAEPSTAAVSAPAEPSASTAESVDPSEAAVAGPCLDAEILAAIEAYKDGDIPAEPSIDEIADAFAALELEGRPSDLRDGVVEALRGETGETLDNMKFHDALFSLIPLESEIALVAC
jgi:hypothetical protein